MRTLLSVFIAALFITGCGNHNAPDVSKINVDISIGRFDQAFFENADTVNPVHQVAVLEKQFPRFTYDFFEYILGTPLPAATDSSQAVYGEMKRFYRITKTLYDSLSPGFKNMAPLQKELEQAFRYVKYYFPAYKVPQIITYVGPFDAPGVAVTTDAMAIGLQLFAGKDFSFYTSTEGQELYPMYISRRFEPQYITPNCMKAAMEDMYPDNSQGKPLIEQIIEKGKRWYVLDKLLPDAPDSLKTDYTKAQLKWVDANEGLIWNFVLQGTDIYTTDPSIVKNFIGEAPSTNGMTDSSPGNIGQWIGWQIVKTYAEKNPALTPDNVMKLDAKTIFKEAKYKPK